MTQNKEIRWVRLGDFIQQIDIRNNENLFSLDDLRGLSIQKTFIDTKAKMDGLSLTAYKLVPPKAFCYVTITSRNSEKITLALNESDDTYIVSSSYLVFKCIEEKKLLPEYLFLWFNISEFDRYARFNSWGSARESFSWVSMQLVQIPVPYKDGEPDIERQQEIVDVWQGLRKLKEDNEALARPLLDLCDAKMDELKHTTPMVKLGEYIEQRDERNNDGKLNISNVRGLATSKDIISTKANMEGVSLNSYKIMEPLDLAYVPDTSRRGDKISLAHNQSEEKYLLSSISTIFHIKKSVEFDPTFLYLWFCRPEFDRYSRFNSWGSAREAFSWEEMCRVKVPKPSLEVQQAIVDIYHCAKRAKQIASEADKQIKEICPALMQHIIHS